MPITFDETVQTILNLVQEREQLKQQLAEKQQLITNLEFELKKVYEKQRLTVPSIHPESGLNQENIDKIRR